MENLQSLNPRKHAITRRYWACTGPMPSASAEYRPSTGMHWHAYRDSVWNVFTLHEPCTMCKHTEHSFMQRENKKLYHMFNYIHNSFVQDNINSDIRHGFREHEISLR